MTYCSTQRSLLKYGTVGFGGHFKDGRQASQLLRNNGHHAKCVPETWIISKVITTQYTTPSVTVSEFASIGQCFTRQLIATSLLYQHLTTPLQAQLKIYVKTRYCPLLCTLKNYTN